MIYSFKEELETDKLYYSAWLVLLVIGIFCLLIMIASDLEQSIQTLLFVISVGSILTGTLISQVERYVLIEENDLRIDNSLFNKHFIRTYHIHLISNLKYETNVKSNFYTSGGRVKVLGMDVTPESWKDYYYHKEILSFDYEGKNIEIGKWKKAFNGKQLFEMLKSKTG